MDSISNLNLKINYFVTSLPATNNGLRSGRIDKSVLESSLKDLSSKPVYSFICGPNEMIKAVKRDLISIGLEEQHIFYEMWW
jgi:ferredoxin-NADP reductase